MKRVKNSDPDKALKILRHCKVLFVVLPVLVLSQAKSQSPTVEYARYVIDTLCSAVMNGRGYVDSGDFKAATFIKNEIKQMGALPVKGNYFQTFSLNPNVYPDEMLVSLAGKELVAGKDYLVQPFSNSVKGTYFLFVIVKDSADTTHKAVEKLVKMLLKKDLSKSFIAIQKNYFSKEQFQYFREALTATNCFGARGCMEFTTDKLTWTASQEVLSYCYLQIATEIPEGKELEVIIDITSQFKKNYYSQNVLAYTEGTSAKDSFIVFTAHYDHLGQMGDGTYFPGANDNASGTSMLLNLVKYYSLNPAKYSVAFIFFSGEESGLLGSSYYTDHPMFPLDKIKFLTNLDIVGTGDDGIKVVNATEFPNQFQTLVKLNEEKQHMKVVSPRGKAANSDHYPFYMKGVPCFFIYTLGGISAYHDIYDRPETLPLTDYEDLFRLLIDFTGSF